MGVKWETFTPSEENYLLINENETKMSSRPDPERMEFWNELYKEAGLLSISKQISNIQAKY